MAAPNLPAWQRVLLSRLGAPDTSQNELFLTDWNRAEGGGATNNPFNTTQPGFGAVGNYNTVGVKNYADPNQGLAATIATLRNGKYGNILAALKSGNNARTTASALAASPWGTGSLVLKMLGGAPVTNTGHGGISTQQVAKAAVQGSQGPQEDSRTALLSMLQQSLQSYASTGQNTLNPMSLTALKQQVQNAPLATPHAPPGTPLHQAKVDNVVSATEKYIGTPYKWGGEAPGGFDCSGLLQYVWRQNGVNIPRTTYDQFKVGTPVAKNSLQPGDAVFFTGSDSKNGLPGHVGMYIGNDKFIEAPHTGAKVQISTLAGRSDYQGARRFV